MGSISFWSKLKEVIRLPRSIALARAELVRVHQQLETANMLTGKVLAERARYLGPRRPLRDAEFKVSSQWGGDGIVQYLIEQVRPRSQTFIEFGVENYRESNTRFLLMNNNWRGLIIDADPQCIAQVRNDEIYWRHDLTAITAFITAENINALINDAGFSGSVGILSVDIDGNDYWVWEKIDVVDPDIVIIEYNSVFGPHRAVSIPYDPAFLRQNVHPSYLFWGCSLAALCLLGERKGYVFVGCDSNGNNAYFVKASRAENLVPLTPAEGYVESRFRESRNMHGKLSFVRGEDRLAMIAHMNVVDVATSRTCLLGDL
jgi:hypothetical protein